MQPNFSEYTGKFTNKGLVRQTDIQIFCLINPNGLRTDRRFHRAFLNAIRLISISNFNRGLTKPKYWGRKKSIISPS